MNFDSPLWTRSAVKALIAREWVKIANSHVGE